MVIKTGGFGSTNEEGFEVAEGFGGFGDFMRADGESYGYGCGTLFTDVLVPDTLGSMDFLSACVAHDLCYTEASAPRNSCDAAFGEAVQAACSDAGYPYLVCLIIGVTYRSGVTFFGSGAYNSPAPAPESEPPLPDFYFN